jgi:hypothetical protein
MTADLEKVREAIARRLGAKYAKTALERVPEDVWQQYLPLADAALAAIEAAGAKVVFREPTVPMKMRGYLAMVDAAKAFDTGKEEKDIAVAAWAAMFDAAPSLTGPRTVERGPAAAPDPLKE